MKKIIIILLALIPTCSTAVLIDVCYFSLIKYWGVSSSTLLFSLESLTLGLSIFAMLYTYTFFKEKLTDLW